MKKSSLMTVFLIIPVVAGITSISCSNLRPPGPTGSPTLSNLDEKSLPPVFSNIELLRGRYYESLHFPDGYSQLVVSSLPTILEAEFKELVANSKLPDTHEKLVAYKVIRPLVDVNLELLFIVMPVTSGVFL